MIKLTECPRDAMQGWEHHIPTATKINYINQLLQVGFAVLDCGSFVSPKAIPQMADTKEVLRALDMQHTQTKLLAIIANERGAQEAVAFENLTYLGFPFSISETFQLQNTNSSITESLQRVEAIQNTCVQNNKEMVVYISMAFGNPYGDVYNVEIVEKWITKLSQLGIIHFSLADTVGMAMPANIAYLFSHLLPAFPNLEIGAHFHSAPHNWQEKIETAYQNGCTVYDSAIKGIGGCPLAQDELVGNMATENVLQFLKEKNEMNKTFHFDKFLDCMALSSSVFV